jgi:hypothetical protein
MHVSQFIGGTQLLMIRGTNVHLVQSLEQARGVAGGSLVRICQAPIRVSASGTCRMCQHFLGKLAVISLSFRSQPTPLLKVPSLG